MRSFGVNAYVADDGVLTGRHTETEDERGHEELFFVRRGRATISVDDEEIDAPAGTFVFVPDPASVRGAVARELGTVVLVLGGKPGAAFEVSAWERSHFPDDA